jgi:Coenzyme PQQ synthesis protein D (PqqD)
MSQLTLGAHVAFSQRATWRHLEDGLAILDLESGTCYELDAVGAHIWDALLRDGSLERAFDELTADYDVEPARLQCDLLTIVQELIDRKLLDLTQDAAGGPSG